MSPSADAAPKPAPTKRRGRGKAKPDREGRIGVRALALLLKVSPTAVSKAIVEGRIRESVTRDGRGRPRMDPAAAVAEYHANTDAGKQRDRGQIGTSVTAALQERRADPHADDDLSYNAYRTEREKYQARQAKIEYEEKAQRLVRSDVVRAEVFRGFRTVRDRILTTVEQLHAELAAETDPRKLRDRLHEAMAAALEAAALETEGKR